MRLGICAGRRAATLGLLLISASCDRPPDTGPGRIGGGTVTPAVIRIEIVAPQQIAPDESVQLTVNAFKSNGSIENVTSAAKWSPAESSTLRLSPTGLATGKARGNASVSATASGRNAQIQIAVVPAGTFRLSGRITESGFGVGDVAVAVISGIGEGLTTVSASDGSFVLFGVSGPIRLHLKKAGYLNLIEDVDVTSHRGVDLKMIAERPRQDYSGIYTLTITADQSCALPEEVKRRVYTATVAQDAGRLTVTLSDAAMIVTDGYGNRFFGLVDLADTLEFQIGDSYWGYYYYYRGNEDIVERVNGGALVVSGSVVVKGTPQLIAGALQGTLHTSIRTTAPFIPYASQCSSATHRFEMVRR